MQGVLACARFRRVLSVQTQMYQVTSSDKVFDAWSIQMGKRHMTEKSQNTYQKGLRTCEIHVAHWFCMGVAERISSMLATASCLHSVFSYVHQARSLSTHRQLMTTVLQVCMVWSVWSLAGTERCNHSAGLQERYHKRSSANSKVKLPVHCSQPQSISRDHGFVWFCCINACPSVPKCYLVTTCFLELWEYEGKGVIWLGESGIFLSFSCRSVWVRQICWTDTLQVANESLPGVGIWRIASRNSSIIWGQSINCT